MKTMEMAGQHNSGWPTTGQQSTVTRSQPESQTMVSVILDNPYRHIPRQTAPFLPAFPKMASRVSETTDDLPTPHQDPYYTLVREDSTPVSRLYLSPTGQEESRDDTANFLLPSGTRCLTLTPRLKFQPPLPREIKEGSSPLQI